VPRLSLTPLLFFALLPIGCGTSSPGASNNSPAPPSNSVRVSPSTASVRAGATESFSATVTGNLNASVSWQVNGVAGGSAVTGTISSGGLYTAPSTLPKPNTITITAVSAANASLSGSSSVSLLNPAPLISAVNPSSFAAGAFTLTVSGSGFASGAQVLFAGAPLNTTLVSATSLTATGTAAANGTFGVSVSNPAPGASTSGAINVQVGSAQSGGGGGTPLACAAMTPGQGADLNGFVPFTAGNLWNQDISGAAVDPNSNAIINFVGANDPVHPDFGAGLYAGQSIGIPYVVVGAGQEFVGVNFSAYGDQSDPGPMPIPGDAPIEGYPAPGSGDRHVLVLDNNNCWLYELYNAVANTDGSWNAGSAAVWDLLNSEQRPLTWTSADAAGLPIFPGLVRYDEVASGQIHHALRFTLQSSEAAFVPPASHWAATSSNQFAAPMGMRLRLKASFDISQFSATNQVILGALKTYGMIMADNGSNMYISGAPDDRWNNDDLHNLGLVTASDFEVMLMNPVYTASNLPPGTPPAITSFTANPAVTSAGSQVILSWSATGASYFIVSPQVGALRGNSVTVTPQATTTYTLSATNQFGRTTASVTATVP
jgi:IPT/TIG domain-containing protein